MNDQPQEPAAPPPPEPCHFYRPGPASAAATYRRCGHRQGLGGMRALGILLALVLLFGAAVMIVAAGEISDTPTAEEVTSGEEPLPSDGKVFDGSEGKRSITTALGYASGVVGAIAVILGFAFAITGTPWPPVRAGRRGRGDPRRDRADHLDACNRTAPARRGARGSRGGRLGPRIHSARWPLRSSDPPIWSPAATRRRSMPSSPGCAPAPRARAAPEHSRSSQRRPAARPTPRPCWRRSRRCSLTAGRRYLLADGVERWTAKQAAPVIEALGLVFRPT